MDKANPVTISAVGDISFAGIRHEYPSQDVFNQVSLLLRASDLVMGNLESPLLDQGVSVPDKCTLKGATGWADILKNNNIRLVTLANNHIMDFGDPGLFSTIRSLDNCGIIHAGAGINRAGACAAQYISIRGMKLAFLARSSVIVSSRCYAGEDSPGIAYFDLDETVSSIRNCKDSSDLVIVSLHWGLEEYLYPTPCQMEQAERLIRSGADIIIGHHPHVLQGIQRIGRGLVAYSLGNFLFHDFHWHRTVNGENNNIFMNLSENNKKGMILRISCQKDRDLETHEIFTKVNEYGRITQDHSPLRGNDFLSFSCRLGKVHYRQWWFFHAIIKEWNLRIKQKFSLNKLLHEFWKIRSGHLKDLFFTMKKSGQIVSGKTTNPYD